MHDEEVPPSTTDARTAPAGRSFAIAGRVERFDRDTRRFIIGGRILRVAPAVQLVGLTNGDLITASGYEQSGRWIVTQFSLD